MKTNILWNNKTIVGVMVSNSPTLDILPPKLLKKWGHVLSLQEQPPRRNPKDEFTDTDGGVYGVRYFNILPSESRCFLVSPSSQFVWETKEATARDFKNTSAVRGHNGFHAAWPESLECWTNSLVDHHVCAVKSLVKGYGDMILGEQGWRSERLLIVKLMFAGNERISTEMLEKSYNVEVIASTPPPAVESITWTTEFKKWLDIEFRPRGQRSLPEFKV